MTPSVDSANPSAALTASASDKLLDQGELIILVIKPSGWFVLLASWPVLVGAAAVAGSTFVAGKAFPLGLSSRMIYFFCVGLVFLRIAFACAQWVGRLYMLTNNRVLNVRGVARIHIDECPFEQIDETILSVSTGERLTGVGTLLFRDDQGQAVSIAWINIARPTEVRQIVEKAIKNRKRQ